MKGAIRTEDWNRIGPPDFISPNQLVLDFKQKRYAQQKKKVVQGSRKKVVRKKAQSRKGKANLT